MTQYADHWRRVLDDVSAVFAGLDAQVSRDLEQSWRGPAARQALETLRRYLAESRAGLTRCRSLVSGLTVLSDAASALRAAIDGLDHDESLAEVRVRYSDPTVAAGNSVDEIPSPPALSGNDRSGASMMSPAQSPVAAAAGPTPTAPAGYGGAPMGATMPRGNEIPAPSS